MVAETDWTKVSFEHGRTTLKKWRECGVRRSEETVELWEHVISRSPGSLGFEQWELYEQVFIAALDCARVDLAQTCIELLHDRFPNSNRVLKLRAMQYEATENFSKAMSIYDNLVETDPNNTSFRKRRIAVLLAQGRRLDAIKALNEYLKIFLNDSEAWLQLSELFLLENDVPKAVHCLEECVLVAPLNSMFLRRLGDLRYTQGGMENVELAKAYYERALRTNSGDLRSQFGLVLCNNYILKHSSSGNEKKKATASANSALNELVNRYSGVEKTNPEAGGIVKTLENMRTTLGSK